MSKSTSGLGTLYLVGTPIGNLEDISYRGLRVLREVALIAAEDTRQTRKLLAHFDIHTPLISYHEHNLRVAGPGLIRRLAGGDDVALVTDAGMPAISDPGEDLVRLALLEGIPVVPVPGPTALTSALVVSGFDTSAFVFEGFLPQRKRERQAHLNRLKDEPRTWILYEAPHRVVTLLRELDQTLGPRRIAAARELTKLHEEVRRGTPKELLEHFQATPPRGEFVIVGEGAPTPEQGTAEPLSPAELVKAVSDLESEGMDRKRAMKEVANRAGLSRREVYQALLDLKEET